MTMQFGRKCFPPDTIPTIRSTRSPPDLFDPNGPRICLGEQRGRPVASDHLEFFDGRSVFLVFFQVPGGRAKTLEYLEKLRDIPKTWRSNPDLPSVTEGRLIPYPEPPQFPIGTRMALLRQMALINDHGHAAATHVTETSRRDRSPFSGFLRVQVEPWAVVLGEVRRASTDCAGGKRIRVFQVAWNRRVRNGKRPGALGGRRLAQLLKLPRSRWDAFL